VFANLCLRNILSILDRLIFLSFIILLLLVFHGRITMLLVFLRLLVLLLLMEIH